MGRSSYLEFEEARELVGGNGEVEAPVRDEIFYLDRAKGAMILAEYAIALKYYSRALSFHKGSEPAWMGQCLALLDLGEFSEADLWADRGLAYCPGSGPLFAIRACAMARRGMQGKAMGFIDRALQTKRDHWLIWLGRGETLTMQGKIKNVDHCISKALEAGGEDRAYILRRAGEMLVLYNHARAALFYLRKAQQEAPDQPLNNLRLAQACKTLNRNKEARHYVEMCLVKRPDLQEAQRLKDSLQGLQLMAWVKSKFKR